MSELPDPISDVLEDTVDEARVHRLWRGIEQGRPRRRWPAPVAVVGLAAAAALVLWIASRPPTPAPDGSLATAGGAPLASVVEQTLELSDGSRVVPEPGARLELLRNDGRAVSWLLVRGAARFEVTPGGPRTWSVEAGLATVEVVGTVFTVSRREEAVEVSVERGVVLVRGDRVPDRARRLTAGQSLRVDAPLAAVAPTPRAAEPAEAEPVEPPLPEPVAPTVAEPTSPRPAPPALDAAALLEQADLARGAGQPEEAARLLARAAALDGDPDAGLAAFTLGRLELDQLGRPDRAEAAFARALALRLPPRLREDAMARRVDALARAGRAAEARTAADAYLAAHPNGRHVQSVRDAAGGG